MLVCPQCQFENPNTNKFCQECGTSLTQNTCQACGSLVSFDAVRCQECNADAGVIWWALIVGEQPQKLESDQSIASSDGHLTKNRAAPPAGDVSANRYLDRCQRYRLLEFLPSRAPAQPETETHARVLDCQPFQMSLLEALTKQEADVLETEPSGSTERSDAGLALDAGAPGAPGVNWATSVQAMAVPAMAQPYLTLGSKFHQALPIIHDAWQQDGQQVILLEDRSSLPRLIDLWLDDSMTLPPSTNSALALRDGRAVEFT